MVKVISTFGLSEGYDPEETYQLWIREHIPYVKQRLHPELKGYIIGRVVHSLTGGEFFGSVQLSFESTKEAIRAYDRLLANPDEFTGRICNIRRIIIEEKDVM